MKKVFFLAAVILFAALSFARASGMFFLNKKVRKVQRIPFQMYWIQTEDGSSYLVSSNGRFVIEKFELLDMQTKNRVETITDLLRAMKPDISQSAVLYLSEQGRPAALIVVDEYCPYCEKLMKQLLALLEAGRKPKYDLAVAFFPVHIKAVDASCKLMQAGKKKARELYVRWVKTHDPDVWNQQKCSAEVRRKFLTIAARLKTMSGISATPTIVLPDGTRIVGYRNPEFLFEEK